MKCTQCGNNNLLKTHFPYASDSGFGAVDSYICLDCGHYEFFSPQFIDRYSKEKEWIETTEAEIIKLRERIVQLEDPSNAKLIEIEKAQIQKELKSLDITIRQKNELEQKYRALDRNLFDINREIAKNNESIKKLERELKHRKSAFESGSI